MASPRALATSGLVALNIALVAIGWGRGRGTGCEAEVCIGVVLDVGGRGDKSFNDAAYRGLVRAKKELGVGGRVIEPTDGADRESALRQFATQGYDLVIGVGFIFTDDIDKLAREMPEVKFACVDYANATSPDNVTGIRFRENEGSFLVGAIAGLMTTTDAVGFVGGMETPLIRKFEVGYVAGVHHVCSQCRVLTAYAGTDPSAFADPSAGKQLALAQYGRGADIIYHASGKTGAGVFAAARQLHHLVIGVDSDQFHEAPCCVLTSMVKNVDTAVFGAIGDLRAGHLRGGVRNLGLSERGVGFVYDDNNRDRLPAEVIAKVRAIRAQIIAGDIEVPAS
ncbi:MAG TPA: BMP family ABC transporter substrate-binding protein [Kofleriaceae bacterium]|nr:BMP family ABC transporter substrate-binding protein [Kofleriaceae bacterium]